jgi:NADH pyrophosphatase NudC (nudix superfamily)
MIFRLEYESGEPQHDGDEIAAAGFFSFDEMDQMEKVQSLSRWGIEQALKTESGTGINVAGNPIDRPGFELYGLTDVPDSVWGR